MLLRAHTILVPAALGVALLGGCRNQCQELCLELASYAEECGYSIPDSEVDACIDQQAGASDKKVCRDFGDPQTVRSEWTCDEFSAYWGLPAASPE